MAVKVTSSEGAVMGWLVIAALLVVCVLGWVMYRRRNVSDEHRTLRGFDPSDVRSRVERTDLMGPSLRSSLRKDPGAPPKY